MQQSRHSSPPVQSIREINDRALTMPPVMHVHAQNTTDTSHARNPSLHMYRERDGERRRQYSEQSIL